MKNMHALSLLIDRAESERDKQMRQAQALRRTALDSRAMLARLEGFRSEFITRAPDPSGPAVGVDCLDGRVRFLGALGSAIGSQRGVCAEREQAGARADAQLVEQQRRLLALQALRTRRTDKQLALQVKQDQRESDAWATLATHKMSPGDPL